MAHRSEIADTTDRLGSEVTSQIEIRLTRIVNRDIPFITDTVCYCFLVVASWRTCGTRTHTTHMSNPAQCAALQPACCDVLLSLEIPSYTYTARSPEPPLTRHPTPHCTYIAHTDTLATRFFLGSQSHANCSICIMLLAACLTILHAQQPRVVVWTREVHGHNLQ